MKSKDIKHLIGENFPKRNAMGWGYE